MAKKTRAGAPKTRSGNAGANAAFEAMIEDIVMANRILYQRDVMDGYGHVSGRDPRNPDRFWMSRARAPGLVVAADIMEFGLDGEPIRDAGKPIYSERFIHSEVYRARSDVNSVVHTHSPTVVPFTVTQVPFKSIRAPFLFPEVPVWEIRDAGGWTDLLVKNSKLGASLAAKLGKNSVALLRGHGNVVVGPTVRIAAYRAVYTEANAQLLLKAKMLGGPIEYLAPEEAEIMEANQMRVRPGHGHDRNWELWKSEALAGSRKR